MRIVHVVWLDALAIAEWTTRGEPVLRQQCDTVGYLVEDTHDHVVVATTVSEDQYNGAIQIPRSMIESITDLLSPAFLGTPPAAPLAAPPQ